MANGDSKKKEEAIEEIISPHIKAIQSFKARADKNRGISEKFADWMTGTFGSVHFLLLNFFFFVFWLAVNLNMVPGFKPFDPFPFQLLTTAVSLEAIILAVFVLISQNRAAKVDQLRNEVDFQLNIISEQEITKVLNLLSEIAEKNKIDTSKDKELEGMRLPTNTDRIERTLEKQLESTNTSIPKPPLNPLKIRIPTV